MQSARGKWSQQVPETGSDSCVTTCIGAPNVVNPLVPAAAQGSPVNGVAMTIGLHGIAHAEQVAQSILVADVAPTRLGFRSDLETKRQNVRPRELRWQRARRSLPDFLSYEVGKRPVVVSQIVCAFLRRR